jgi:hypothetical protein
VNRLALVALVSLAGCAADPLRPLDLAAEQGLVRWEPIRPHARLTDWTIPGVVWQRGVEVAR